MGANWLWFLFGVALSGSVFGLLAWAEELKSKRIELEYANWKTKVMASYDDYKKKSNESVAAHKNAALQWQKSYIDLYNLSKRLLSEAYGMNITKDVSLKDLN